MSIPFMYKVQVTVHSHLGSFTGYFGLTETQAQAEMVRNRLHLESHTMASMTLTDKTGTNFHFSAEILRKSVIEVKVVSKLETPGA